MLLDCGAGAPTDGFASDGQDDIGAGVQQALRHLATFGRAAKAAGK